MTTPGKATVLITGASSGLGSALADRLAADGLQVAIHYRSNEKGATRIRDAILARKGSAAVFQADLSVEHEATSLAQAVMAQFGGIDILINNTGTYHAKDLHALSAEEWKTGLDSTATAAFLTTRACLPFLRISGKGRIINIGDSAADRPGARNLAVGYHIGKMGVWMLTRSFAQSEAPHGISVNMVSPGYLENSLDLPPSGEIPAGRHGTFDDMYAAVCFLIAAPAYISGSNIVASGGWNLG